MAKRSLFTTVSATKRATNRRVASRAIALAALLAGLPTPVLANPVPVLGDREPGARALENELRKPEDAELLWFYIARGYRPLWWTPQGELDPAARSLVQLIETSSLDGLEPNAVDSTVLSTALEGLGPSAPGSAKARAEFVLSKTLVNYVKAMRRAPVADMAYEHVSLQPHVPTVADVLRDAVQAPSLTEYVEGMRWMHPLYAQLRQALAADRVADAETRGKVLANLERLRAIPPAPSGRYVLVDTAAARLWMYEQGRAVDSMRVVVGKPDQQTPMMSGYIRHAVLDPYWNVPPDLVQRKIAPNVLRRGVGYLKTARYEVLSDWTELAEVVDPATIDWKAVANGSAELRVRQLPSPGNAMGKVKFEFPNSRGIYLHDTPDKNLMLREARQFSSGCIRLEDAQRLGRWLLRSPLPAASAAPEQKVQLPAIVPIYITHLTAHSDGGRIALGPDPYKRDSRPGTALAQGASQGMERSVK